MEIVLDARVHGWEGDDDCSQIGLQWGGSARSGGAMRMRWLLVSGVVACSEASVEMDAAVDESVSSAEMDTASFDGEAADRLEQPAHWRLSGTLLVNDGLIQPELSFLRVVIMGDADGALCDDNVGIVGSVRQSEVPEGGVHAWWEVEGTNPEESSCLRDVYSNPLPSPVYLGIGAMHPEIEAVVAGIPDLDTVEGSRIRSVYAAMAQDASVWVFGMAETSSEEETDIDPRTGSISVDGNWKFSAVYSFQLTD